MSADKLRISIDAMGGDLGPEMVIPAVNVALERHPEISITLHGNRITMAPLLDRHPLVRESCEIKHTDVAVSMADKPSQALRHGRKVSSMWQSIEAVKEGSADVVVSAGNTGALMAMARFVLRTMPGIQRPAIAAIWPTTDGACVVLDVGATIGADAEQLVDYAIMGEAMARCLLGIQRPSVGLLNVGVEEIKGVEQVKEAGKFLRGAKLPIEYYGFVEGDDIGKGTVDVVVTEGFSGNIALKTAEGTARQISSYLRTAARKSLLSRIGFLLASATFADLKEQMDPRNSNGGVFLGLNGVVVKSHGGTDSLGFANAIDNAIDMVRNELVSKIAADIERKQGLWEGPQERNIQQLAV